MYSMELSIFGMKFRLEILILIVILYWLIWGNVLCSCSRVSPMEAFTTLSNITNNVTNKLKNKGKEAFGTKTMYSDESAKYSLSNKPLDTKSWFLPDLTYSKGSSSGPGVQNILNRQQQQLPLPEGEMLIFANTPFKPECCPNTYSNSSGCACMDVKSYDYLINRGGNNVPYSEY